VQPQTCLMPRRSSPAPKGSIFSSTDPNTYRDVLLFEERLKMTAASLQRRKSRYQRALHISRSPLMRLTAKYSVSVPTFASNCISACRSPITPTDITARHSIQIAVAAPTPRALHSGNECHIAPLFCQRNALCQCHYAGTLLCEWDVFREDCIC
jgi:hypothetical protein